MKKITLLTLSVFALTFNIKAQNGLEYILIADISDANTLTTAYFNFLIIDWFSRFFSFIVVIYLKWRSLLVTSVEGCGWGGCARGLDWITCAGARDVIGMSLIP